MSDGNTISALLGQLSRQLQKIAVNPLEDAQRLLLHVLNHAAIEETAQPHNRAFLYTHPDTLLTAEQLHLLQDLIAQRLRGKPLEYILGYQDFWDIRLLVNEHTLIPRPETELLVEHALNKLKMDQNVIIADAGCGSGAIMLAIARQCPRVLAIGVDSNSQALAIARQNARRLEIKNCALLQSNWFSALKPHCLDIVIANPPYIDRHDPMVDKQVKDFEPHQALFSPNQGLADLQQIIQDAPRVLRPEGWLLLEHGYQQQQAVKQLLRQNHFIHIQHYRDLNDLPRISLAQTCATDKYFGKSE